MIKEAIAHQVLEGACKGFVAGGVTIEDFRKQMMHMLDLVPRIGSIGSVTQRAVSINAPISTTDIKLSHADLPGVITEALRASIGEAYDAANQIIELREVAKDVSKALVLHARRNGG